MNMIPPVRATEQGRAQHVNPKPSFGIVVLRAITRATSRVSPLEKGVIEGENPVHVEIVVYPVWLLRVAHFGRGVQNRGNFPLELNIGLKPIAYKYCEGKMKIILERELKVREIAKREANETSFFVAACIWLR